MNDFMFISLENRFTCCGIKSLDGFITYSYIISEACKTTGGFTSKPHPHCTYIIGTYIMNQEYAVIASMLSLCCMVITIGKYLMTRVTRLQIDSYPDEL